MTPAESEARRDGSTTSELGITARWVAGLRALESEREAPLFRDPFARRLAGDAFVEKLRHRDPDSPDMPPAIEVRTRWLDDQILLALGRGIRQVVILASGMDARGYRLAWAPGTRLFEIDHAEVLDDKQSRLQDVSPKCERYEIAVDLQADWPAALRERGFDEEAATLWLAEGLLVYLPESLVLQIMARLDALSGPESVALVDVVGLSMLESSRAEALHHLANQFGTDEPEQLLAPLGWDVHVHSTAAVGEQLGRWPYPVHPRGTPGIPQAYLVYGLKRSG